MKTNFKPILMCLFCGLLTLSCSSYKYIDLQVLQPAAIQLPYQVKDLYIIEPKKYLASPEDSIYSAYYQTVISGFSNTLRDALKKSPVFADSSVHIAPFNTFLNMYRSSPFGDRKKIYSLFVKSLSIQDTVYTTFISFENLNCLDCYNYQKVLRIRYKIDIQLKNAIIEKPVDSFEMNDTLMWMGPPMESSVDTSVTFNKEAAYDYTGNHIAKAYALRISPVWKNEERSLFYSPNYLMRKAYRSFSNNRITQAIDLWSEVYKTGTRHLAAMAAHNLALCFETIDELPQTKEWLEKAIQTKKFNQSVDYLQLIEKRMNERDLLNSQIMGPK